MRYRMYVGDGSRIIVCLSVGLMCIIMGLAGIYFIDESYGMREIGIVFIVLGFIFLVPAIIMLLKACLLKLKYNKKQNSSDQTIDQTIRKYSYDVALRILPKDNHFSKMSKGQMDALKFSFHNNNTQCLSYFMKYPSRDVLEFIHSVNTKIAEDIATAVLVAENDRKKTNG